MKINKIKLMGLLPTLFALLLGAAVPVTAQVTAPAVMPQKTDDGSYSVILPDYTATINAAGWLASLKVRGIETLGNPLEYARNAKLVADTLTPAENALQVHFKGPGGQAQIDYAFHPDGIVFTTLWKGGGFADVRLTGSDALQGIELLNDKTTHGGESVRYVTQGEVRGVPAFSSNRNQMVRLHYAGFGLRTHVQRWGAPFNYESAGTIEGRSWHTDLLGGNQPFPIFLTIQPDNTKFSLPAVPFAPRSNRAMSLFYSNEPCTWSLDFGERKSYAYLLDAGVHNLRADWQLFDINDQPCGQGTSPLSLDPATTPTTVARLILPVTIKTPGSGWYQAVFRLTDATGKMAASEFRTRFTVINPTPGLLSRPDDLADKAADDYATVGLIGIGGIRESHPCGEFLSNNAPPANSTDWVQVAGTTPPVWLNGKVFDEIMNRGATESKKYGVNWFFQWNSRPGWATAPIWDAVAYAMVSRGKNRCKVWECENEPNGGYSPTDYLQKAVIPFATGAKRADPTCIIMGPGCVGIKPTLEFMETIYKLGGGKYFDQISTHSYPGPGESWEQFGNIATLERLHALMKANGDAGKPLWQTEQGYTWDLNPPLRTARYATRQFLVGAAEGIPFERQYYFYPKAHGFEAWYQAGGGEEGSRDGWLPLAAAQHFAAENLVGTHYLRSLPLPYKGVQLARFAGPKGDVVAAWTFDFDLKLPVRAPGLERVVGFDGNVLPLKPGADGRVTLPLSGEPIYLHLRANSPVQVGQAWGRNLAAQAAGGVVTTSATSSDSRPEYANDENWNLWEPVLDMPGRTAWKAAAEPTADEPATVEVAFPVARTLTRAVALCYLPAISAAPRDWKMEVESEGNWKTVAQAKDWEGWAIYTDFAPVKASKLRLVVTRVNDGWLGDHSSTWVNRGADAPSYTGGKLLVSELEAYGPASPLELTAALQPLSAGAPSGAGVMSETRTLAVQVQNRGEAFSGTVAPRLPAGFTASPPQRSVKLAAKSEQNLTFTVTKPREVPTGTLSVGVALQDTKNTPLDVATDTLTVQGPLQITPRTPGAAREGGQPLTLSLHNISASPVAGSIAVTPTDGNKVESQFEPIKPGESHDVELLVPGLNLAGKVTSLPYTIHAGGFVTSLTQRVQMRGWQILGPFPNDFDRAFGPETALPNIDLTAATALPSGQTARWTPAAEAEDGLIDLLGMLSPNNNVSAYASIWIKSPTARKATVSLGSDDGVRAWWNAANLWNNNAARGAAPGEDKFPVDVKAGWNHVLLKITQGGGGWGFYFDLLDPQTGKPLSDITYSPQQQ